MPDTSTPAKIYSALKEAFKDSYSDVVLHNLAVDLALNYYQPWDIPDVIRRVESNVSVEQYRNILLNSEENLVFYHGGICFVVSPHI